VQGLGTWSLSLEALNTNVPCLPTFLFEPLLHVPFYPKVIMSFNKQTLPTHS